MVVRLIQGGICLLLGILCAINLPEELSRANVSVTAMEKGLVTVSVVACYFAIPMISFKNARAANLFANAFCILCTPYVAFLLFFSGWSVSSEQAAHWLVYVLIGNVVLFFAALVGIILSFSKGGG